MKVCEKCKHYTLVTRQCTLWHDHAAGCVGYSALNLCPRCHHYNRDSCILPPTTEFRTVSKCSGFLSSIHEICTRCGHYDGEALICTAPYRVVSSDALICSAFIAKAEQKCITCAHYDTGLCLVTKHYMTPSHDATHCNMYYKAPPETQCCRLCVHNHEGVMCTERNLQIFDDWGIDCTKFVAKACSNCARWREVFCKPYAVDNKICPSYLYGGVQGAKSREQPIKETVMKKCCGTCVGFNSAEQRCKSLCDVDGGRGMPVKYTWGAGCGRYRVMPSSTELTFETYQRRAVRTAKRLTSLAEKIQRGALGIAGEAGEIAELIKKNQYQDRPLNYDDLEDEMGDLLWYLAVLADDLDMGLCNVAARNIKKLERRYPDGYETLSDKAKG